MKNLILLLSLFAFSVTFTSCDSPLLQIASNTLGMLNKMFEESPDEAYKRQTQSLTEGIANYNKAYGTTKMALGQELFTKYQGTLKMLGGGRGSNS